MKIEQIIARLDQDFDAIANQALSRGAEGLSNDVRQALSTAPGGPHDHPWRETGALRDSVSWQSNDNQAVVGSTSPNAAYQEFGTPMLPPRPTLAPAAMQSGQSIANAIGNAVTNALAGR
jgi:phage gpG-like protein